MNFEETLEYIESVSWKGSVPGLERISKLCEGLGHPERKMKYVHVAGTNGKGSVSAIVSSVLTASGYKTGLFTSPHLADIRERIAVDGEYITHEDMCRAAEKVKEVGSLMEDSPTEFEILTAMAFVYFAESGCDIAVLECGMGGRLDATNVIDSPEVSVITNIALDHTSVLGNTELEIAGEKAGIIKGAPVVIGKMTDEVKAFFETKCSANNLSLTCYDEICAEPWSLTADGLRFTYSGESILLPLCGSYQKINLRTALAVISVLEEKYSGITNDSVKRGIENVRWIGRFEKLCEDPTVIFDGAHNPDGVRYTVDTFSHLYPENKAVLVTGVMADKEYESIAETLSSVSCSVFTVVPDNSRALSALSYAKLFEEKGIRAKACSSVKEGIENALKEASSLKCPVLCAGSLYMYGEVLSAVNEILGR